MVSVFSTQFVEASIAYTADNGENWNYVSPEDIHYVQSYGMDYDFEGNNVNAYIATPDLGVLRYVIENATLNTNHPIAGNNPMGLYPNPASGDVKVFTNDGFDVSHVAVYALTGQKVLENQSATLDVSGLSNGIYMVKVQTNSGKSFTQKLVKK